MARPSNFRLGTHVRFITSVLSRERTSEVLSVLDNSPALPILKKYPLRSITLTRSRRRDISGLYDRSTADIEINTVRRKYYHYGEDLVPGRMFRVGAATQSKTEAMRRALLHEVGHHIEETGGAKAERIMLAAFASRVAKPISGRAGVNVREYFAENWVLYHLEPTMLRQWDLVAYDMIEDVLKVFDEVGQ